MRLAVVLVVLAALGVDARAEDDIARAKACFERGRQRFSEGDFAAAAREFEAGYELSPRPLFLVNLGQTYRQLGKLEHARDLYRHFLDQAAPDDPQRPIVERIVAELDQKIAEQRAQPPPVVAPTPEPVVAPAVAPVPPPPKKPFIKRFWWIIPVSAVVVAGVAVGIYFGVHPPGSGIDCTGATLGCLK